MSDEETIQTMPPSGLEENIEPENDIEEEAPVGEEIAAPGAPGSDLNADVCNCGPHADPDEGSRCRRCALPVT